MVSCDSDCSSSSGDSNTKLVESARNSPLSKKKSSRQKIAGSIPNSVQGSPAIQPKFSLRGSYTKFRSSSSVKGSTESLELRKLSPKHTSVSQLSIQSETPETDEPALKWAEDDVFVVDMTTRKVMVHHNCSLKTTRQSSDSTGDSDHTDKDGVKNSSETESPERLTDIPSEVDTDAPTSTDRGRDVQEGGKMDGGDIQQEREGASQQPATQDAGKKEGASQQLAAQGTGKTESQQPAIQGTEEGRTAPQRQTPVTPRKKKKNGEHMCSLACNSVKFARFSQIDLGLLTTDNVVVRRFVKHLVRLPCAAKALLSHNDVGTNVSIHCLHKHSSASLTQYLCPPGKPLVRSIVNEVFEGTLESRVKCLACKKVSSGTHNLGGSQLDSQLSLVRHLRVRK